MSPLFIVGAIVLGVLVVGGSKPSLHALATHFGLPAPPPMPGAPPPPPPLPPPRPQGLTFAMRNQTAIDALVSALVTDPNLNAPTLNIYAEQFALYGFDAEADELRRKAAIAPQYTAHEIQTGITQLWEQQAKQGFW